MGTMDAKILVVDDAKYMRRLLRQMLGEGGYRDSEEAADGDEALLRFRLGSGPGNSDGKRPAGGGLRICAQAVFAAGTAAGSQRGTGAGRPASRGGKNRKRGA